MAKLAKSGDTVPEPVFSRNRNAVFFKIQIAASMDHTDGDLFLMTLLDRFDITEWTDLSLESEEVPFRVENYEQLHRLGDEFLA